MSCAIYILYDIGIDQSIRHIASTLFRVVVADSGNFDDLPFRALKSREYLADK